MPSVANRVDAIVMHNLLSMDYCKKQNQPVRMNNTTIDKIKVLSQKLYSG
ncbi:hypothetical protein [Aliivibrio fischeri]|uniref:Uncharacterized protein n=1 Tax=Aliivibrio fischeri SR5 TaxID=1088719 RepID=A0AAV3EMI0_ALIFS|nr:hypothetical protein [Aliivibrio fischeri]EHN68035.1 hypothetical protein VFSR5_A0616 [Aliivibrio fischeri SR5]